MIKIYQVYLISPQIKKFLNMNLDYYKKNFNLNKSNIIKSKFTEKLKLTKRPLNMFIQNSKLKKINKNINFDINQV